MGRKSNTEKQQPAAEPQAQPDPDVDLDTVEHVSDGTGETMHEVEELAEPIDAVDDEELATTSVTNAPSLKPPVPTRIDALLRETAPPPPPPKPKPAWVDHPQCDWLPFFALRVTMKLHHKLREFRRSGLLFKRSPRTLYPSDLKELGEAKVFALLSEEMLVCEPLTLQQAIEAYLAQ